MKKRSLVSLFVCGAVAMGATLGLTGCGEKGLTVWGSQSAQPMLKEMVAAFQEQNPDITVPINVGVCGEDSAYATISKDPSASADVYGYANDQIVNLKKIGALAKLGTAMVDKIKADNDEGSVNAAKIGNDYYGYPYASDNGYFMYYDKSVVKEESLGDLDSVLQDCYDNGKYFIYNQRESFYVSSFFFGAGGTYSMEWGGEDYTQLISSTCNFNEKPAGENYTYGQIGATAHIELNEKTLVFMAGDDTVISQYLNSNMAGAIISGTWNAKIISEKLGANYAATKMPKFKSSLTGKSYQMNSLIGYKLYGVNPNTAYPVEAHKLAAFLASQEMQEKRFDALQTGPSNKVVAEMDKVKSNVALAGFAAQRSAENGTTPLGAFPSSYWDAMKGFGEGVNGTKPDINKSNLDAKLATFISGLIKTNTEEA